MQGWTKPSLTEKQVKMLTKATENQKNCPPVSRRGNLILTTKYKKKTLTNCYDLVIFTFKFSWTQNSYHIPQFNSWLYLSMKSEMYSVPFPQDLGRALPHTTRMSFGDQLKTEPWQSSSLGSTDIQAKKLKAKQFHQHSTGNKLIR